MRHSRAAATLAATSTVLALALQCRPAAAIDSWKTVIEAMPMPPASSEIVYDLSLATYGIGDGDSHFTSPGFWTYATQGIQQDDPRQMAWFRYRDVGGRNFTVRSNWGVTASGNGIPNTGCGHSHHVYVIWVRVKMMSVWKWVMIGSGGKVGRLVNGACQVSEQPTGNAAYDESFVWGPKEYTFNVPSGASEMIVGTQSQTHGWGTRWGQCGDFACFDLANVMLWRNG